MEFTQKYMSQLNYIGCSEWQYKFTDLIYKKCSAINYTAYVHDNLYKFLWTEKYFISILLLKFCFDIVFLIMGITRSLRKFQVFGVPLTMILFSALIIGTPYYIWRVYNK